MKIGEENAATPPPQPPSDLFVKLICSGGAGAQVCEFCGREYLCSTDTAYWDQETLKDWRAKAEKEPDRYIEDQQYSSIEYGELDGRLFVLGCDCNSARRYEDFIWGHRELISKYLKERTTSRLADATRDSKLAELMAGGLLDLEKAEAEAQRLKALCELNGISTKAAPSRD